MCVFRFLWFNVSLFLSSKRQYREIKTFWSTNSWGWNSNCVSSSHIIFLPEHDSLCFIPYITFIACTFAGLTSRGFHIKHVPTGSKGKPDIAACWNDFKKKNYSPINLINLWPSKSSSEYYQYFTLINILAKAVQSSQYSDHSLKSNKFKRFRSIIKSDDCV